MPGLPLKIVTLVAICLLGLAWAWMGSSEIKAISRSNILMFLAIFSIALAINFKSFILSIPWRGDEDFHISFTKWIASQMESHLNYFIPFILFLILISLSKIFSSSNIFTAIRTKYLTRLNKPYLPSFIFLSVSLAFALFTFSIIYISKNIHIDLYQVLRYPIIIKYLTGLMVFLFNIFPLQILTSHLGNEFPYRIIPLISASLIAFSAHQSLSKTSFSKSNFYIPALAIIFLLTIPLIRYYSTIFYLEMPAVLCISLIALSKQNFLKNSFEDLKNSYAWYGLILLGLIKETVLPFLFALIFCRLIFQFALLLKDKSKFTNFIRDEFKFIFISCLPLFLYLFFRFRFGNSRGYSPHLNYLTDFHLLSIQMQSLWDSFGILLILIIPGSILAWKKRPREIVLFFFFAILLEFLFHFLDEAEYTGYSRFNLFLFPSFLFLAWEATLWLTQRSPQWTKIVFCLAIALNFSMSPIHFDGTRKPSWGVYGSDIGEYDFPFRHAFSVIKTEYPDEKICLSGLNYPYFLNFYFSDKNNVEQISFQSVSIKEIQGDPMKYLDSAIVLSQAQGCHQLIYAFYTNDSESYLKAISQKPFLKNPQSHLFKNQNYSLGLFNLFPKLNHHVQSSKPSSNL